MGTVKNTGKLLSFLWIGNIISRAQKNIFELAKIKTAIYYLGALQGVRRTLILLVQIILSIIFLTMGIFILHVSLFFLASEGGSFRVRILLGLGGMELLSSLAFLGWFLSSGRWVREAARTNRTLRKLMIAQKRDL